jgi:hypothetical protein
MESVKNILFNLDDSQNIEYSNLNNKNIGNIVGNNASKDVHSESLIQGSNFNNYKDKITINQELNDSELIEGFTGTRLTEQSRNV